jgi:hypothetical protein
MVFETLVFSPLNHLTRLIARENFIIFSRRESNKFHLMHFLQRSTHLSKTCCRPLITSKFLASVLTFHGWKSPDIAGGEI